MGWGKQVVVIGGGPAGLMAAGQAALVGTPVLLLDRAPRLGIKLGMTGNGRCNLTNLAEREEFLTHFASPDGWDASHLFLRNAFTRFFASDLLAFFEGLGVSTTVEQGGRVFAAGHDAHQVANTLVRFVSEQGVQIRLRSRAVGLLRDGGRLRGLVLGDGAQIEAGAVVVATGGASYPQTGSTGDGYRLAEEMGHTIVPIHPALVPLVVSGPEPRALTGVSLPDVRVRLLLDGQELAHATGDLLFTHFGVSGPVILTLSRLAVERLWLGRLEASINLRPDLSPEDLDAQLLRVLDRFGRRALRTCVKEWVPDRMAESVVSRAGLPPEKPAHQITAVERQRLREVLQDFRLAIVDHRPLAEAMVTAGGVDAREVDPRTMGSRLVTGLYFAGEVLNVQADTGGFNLQAAFSTGYVAGRAAARFVAEQALLPAPESA